MCLASKKSLQGAYYLRLALIHTGYNTGLHVLHPYIEIVSGIIVAFGQARPPKPTTILFKARPPLLEPE